MEVIKGTFGQPKEVDIKLPLRAQIATYLDSVELPEDATGSYMLLLETDDNTNEYTFASSYSKAELNLMLDIIKQQIIYLEDF